MGIDCLHDILQEEIAVADGEDIVPGTVPMRFDVTVPGVISVFAVGQQQDRRIGGAAFAFRIAAPLENIFERTSVCRQRMSVVRIFFDLAKRLAFEVKIRGSHVVCDVEVAEARREARQNPTLTFSVLCSRMMKCNFLKNKQNTSSLVCQTAGGPAQNM